MTARGLPIVALSALPLLAGSEANVCQSGGPELIVTGTVLAVELPHSVCVTVGGSPAGAETCLASPFLQCATRAAVFVEPPDRPGFDVSLAPFDPPIEHAGSLRMCDLAPGSYALTLCPDDPEPLTCRTELDAGVVIGPVVGSEGTSRIRLRIETIEAGDLPASSEPAHTGELSFFPDAGRLYDVGQSIRVELARTGMLTDMGILWGDFVEYHCYLSGPPRPPRHTGCAGCAGGGPAGAAPLLLAALAGVSRRRRR